LNTSKQGFYQLYHRNKRQQEETFTLIDIIQQVRANHPTMSCRMLHYKIKPEFIGRDRFEDLCREYGFMVSMVKNWQKTTNSNGVIRFDNLVNDFELSGIDQIWSSDITYFPIGDIFYYITFILDNHSRRILGYHVSSKRTTEQTSLPALKMAIKTRKKPLKKGIIFHTDGGGQYYDDHFLSLTRKYKFKNSMCEYAWENGKAERINGIIKNNYLNPWGTKTVETLKKNLDRAVKLYNEDKPHSGLDKLTPVGFEKKLINLATETKA
jgi:transposase InsO family protein